jgi:hypothetical protein
MPKRRAAKRRNKPGTTRASYVWRATLAVAVYAFAAGVLALNRALVGVFYDDGLTPFPASIATLPA